MLKLIDRDSLVDCDTYSLVDNDAFLESNVLALVEALVLASPLASSDAFTRHSFKLALSLSLNRKLSDFSTYSLRYSF